MNDGQEPFLVPMWVLSQHEPSLPRVFMGMDILLKKLQGLYVYKRDGKLAVMFPKHSNQEYPSFPSSLDKTVQPLPSQVFHTIARELHEDDSDEENSWTEDYHDLTSDTDVKHDPLPWIHLDLKDEQGRKTTDVKSLLDSGATFGLARKSFIEKCGLSLLPLPTNKRYPSSTQADGTKIHPIGMAKFAITLPDNESTSFQTFFVFEKLALDIIVGAMTFARLKSRLDWNTRQFSFKLHKTVCLEF